MQDSIVGALHGDITVPLDIFSAVASAGVPTLVVYNPVSGIFNSYWNGASAASQVALGLRLPAGTIIKNISLHGSQDGATPMTWSLLEQTSLGVASVVEAHAGDASTGDKSLSVDMARPIVAGRMYYLLWNAGQADDRLYFPEITIAKTT